MGPRRLQGSLKVGEAEEITEIGMTMEERRRNARLLALGMEGP